MYEVFLGLTDGKDLKKKYTNLQYEKKLKLNKNNVEKIYGVFEGDIEKSIIYRTKSLNEAITVAKNAKKYFNQRTVYINTSVNPNNKKFSNIDCIEFDTSLLYKDEIYFVGNYFKKEKTDCSLIPYKPFRKKNIYIKIQCFFFSNDDLVKIQKTIKNIKPFVQNSAFKTIYSMEI